MCLWGGGLTPPRQQAVVPHLWVRWWLAVPACSLVSRGVVLEKWGVVWAFSNGWAALQSCSHTSLDRQVVADMQCCSAGACLGWSWGCVPQGV